jgi:uncharacterized membrane protein HdeD (DUF308 family)
MYKAELSEGRVGGGSHEMQHRRSATGRRWWVFILTGLLAIAFGVGAVALPASIILGRFLDMLFGIAKPLSGSMTAVAILLALAALVVIDGFLNLLGISASDKLVARVRGVVGTSVAIAAIFWPGRTSYVAVELIGLWAISIGILELAFARNSDNRSKRLLLIIGAIVAISIGVAIMKWTFAGAVLVSAAIGVAAAARGVALVLIGISERSHQLHREI